MEKQAFEPTGLIPRSIIRTVDRFVQQLLPGREKIALQEYRVSRYQILVSIKSLLTLILIPLIISSTIKGLLFTPLVEHFWNNRQSEIFLNEYQEKRAFSEMHDFSEKIFFESLLVDPKPKTKRVEKNDVKLNLQSMPSFVHEQIFLQSEADGFQPTHLYPLIAPSEHVQEGGYKSKICSGYKSNCVRLQIKDLYPICSDIEQEYAQRISTTFLPSHPIMPMPFGQGQGQEKENDQKSMHHCFAMIDHGYAMMQSDQEQSLQSNEASLHSHDRSFSPFLQISDLQDTKQNLILNETLHNQTLFQIKSLELAKSYNKQSILAITNLLGDFLTFFTVTLLFKIMRPELIILKSFLTESVYSLSDTTKSFLLILGMDLLVGFHSPRGWELALEGFLRHIGLPENENFILLFVALFPVFLDTVFKYWIFRYLNKISPSTVVTYHSMIE